MITKTEAEQLEDRHLQERLRPLDFMRTRSLQYEKPFGGSIGRLAFGCRYDPRGFYATSGNVAIRLPRLDSLLCRSVMLQDEGDVVAITMPLHLVGSGGPRERTFRDQSELVETARQIEGEVRGNAIPFLENCATLPAIRSRLESETPADWFALTPEERLILLVSIIHSEGEAREALALLDRALAERENEPLKKRRQLIELRARLGAA